MASLHFFTPVTIFCHILLLLFISHPPAISSQDPSFSSPTIAQCTSSLLPLVPCAPFVQGTAQSPGQVCCYNLKQLYSQVPHCLCLLLNDTTLSSFPINRTLALQLPALCTLQVSTCPGVQSPPPISPATQISFGTKGKPTVAASPAEPVTPRPSIIGFGLVRSDTINLKAGGALAVAMTMASLLLTLVAF